MRIIISPAKKMKVDTDSIPYENLPALLHKTENLFQMMQKMSPDELKRLWKCNDSIAALNIQRLKTMDIHHGLTPAILAYEGIQYQYMAPDVFTGEEFDYIQEHLRILSGFYGILRPFDGVIPYRLEMQSKFRVGEHKDLYAFWGRDLADSLFSESDCIIDLASKEYSVCIAKYLPASVRFITCIFGEEKDGKIFEKGTMCKMARGEMVRYMAEHKIKDPEYIKGFCHMDYCFSDKHSDSEKFVFIKKQPIVD